MAFAPDFAQSGLFYVAYSADTDGGTDARRVPRAGDAGGDRGDAPGGARDRQQPGDLQPQRRPAAVRPRRLPLLVDRRGRERGANAQTTSPTCSARSCASTRAERRRRLHRAGRQPVRRHRRRAAGDLGVRPAQPVALLVRPPHGRDVHRRRRRAAWEEVDYATQASGGGRGANYGWPTCEGLRVRSCADPTFTDPIYAYDQRRPARATRDHGRLRRPRSRPRRPLRPLPVHRPLRRRPALDRPGRPAALRQHRVEGLSAADARSPSARTPAGASTSSPRDGGGRVFRIEGPSGGACPPERHLRRTPTRRRRR